MADIIKYTQDNPISKPLSQYAIARLIGAKSYSIGNINVSSDKIAIWNIRKPTDITGVVGLTEYEKHTELTASTLAAACWSLKPYTVTGVTYKQFVTQLRNKLANATALEKERGLVEYDIPDGTSADPFRISDFYLYVHKLGNSAVSHGGGIVLNFMGSNGYIDEIDTSSAGTVQTYNFNNLVDGQYPTSGELTVPWLLKMYFERKLGVSDANSMTHVYYANGHIAKTGESLPISKIVNDLEGVGGNVEQYEFYTDLTTLNDTNIGRFVFIPGGNSTSLLRISHQMNLGTPTFDGFMSANSRLDFILALTNNIESINGLSSWAAFANKGLKCKMFISKSSDVPNINLTYTTGDVIYVHDLTTDANFKNTKEFQTSGYGYWQGNDWTDSDDSHYIHIVYQWLNSSNQTVQKSVTQKILCINPVS